MPSDQSASGGAPPDSLRAYWQAAGVIRGDMAWAPLAGGRTNSGWKLTGGAGLSTDLVCKLYRPGASTPLFGNDPEAEALALGALAGSGLAPGLVATGHAPDGPSLVYRHVAGRPWRAGDDPAPVARALAQLHERPAPPGLPEAPIGAAAICAQGAAMAAEAGADLTAPTCPDLPPVPRVFLHGDATAGNALVTETGITFIDWQCPARGDAADDLATFLSPAMQRLSGNRPLHPEEEQRFLDAYGDPAVAARVRALAPAFAYRMAAYCLWRAARGEAGYGAAAALERARFS